MERTFWNGFFETIDLEIGSAKTIQGASGINHKIKIIGVDENKKRIVIVQEEQDPRILAMAQADIQAKMQGYNVLMVRPVSINLSTAFSSAAILLGGFKFSQEHLKALAEKSKTEEIVDENKKKIENLFSLVAPQIEIIQKTKPNLVAVFQEVVHQLSTLKFVSGIEDTANFMFDFEEILNFNPVVYDNNLGICPIPFYDFSIDEAESFFKSNNKEINKMILKKHGIYQFFYPPVDSLALGLIENNNFSTESLENQIVKVPSFGHPFGENELTDAKNLADVVDALKQKGLAVEGEFSLGLTKDGQDKRMLVKFSPRESIFKRIANILSIKVDINLNDIIGKP